MGPSGEVLEQLKGHGPGCRIIDDLSGLVLSKMGVKWAEERLGAVRGGGVGGGLATLLPLRMTIWDYWSTLYDGGRPGGGRPGEKMEWVRACWECGGVCVVVCCVCVSMCVCACVCVWWVWCVVPRGAQKEREREREREPRRKGSSPAAWRRALVLGAF